MIFGHVREGVPTIVVAVAGRNWTAVVDTGFNGDLELPEALRSHVQPQYLCRIRSALAGGVVVEEDNYLVNFPFDGRLVSAEATFTATDEVLLGTGLLDEYRLRVDFPRRRVKLDRSSEPS